MPTESIASYATRFQTAAAGDAPCPRLQQFDAAFFAIGGRCATNRPWAQGLKVRAAASYGTGGVIDVTSSHDPKGATFIVTTDAHGKWTIHLGVSTGRPIVGTTANNPGAFRTDLNGTLAALRQKDCKAFIKYSITPTNGPSACTQPFASGIARALSADPRAAPSALGGNNFVQFYALTLKGYSGHPQATHLIWDVTTTGKGPNVTYPYATDNPAVG